jgi:lysophospholipase L1-like esterase
MGLKGCVFMTTIWIAGDSTASAKTAEKRPEYGWGECLGQYFGDQYLIQNRAENGRSTKSFIDEGKLDMIDHFIKPFDILLIQFGHNDQKKDDPHRYAEAYTDYVSNLKSFVEVAKRHDATPILLTPISRCDFKDGKINSFTHQEYPNAMKEFAQLEHVLCIDLFEITQQKLMEVGSHQAQSYFLHLNPGDSPNYPSGVKDNTHLNEQGAHWIASIIFNHLKK